MASLATLFMQHRLDPIHNMGILRISAWNTYVFVKDFVKDNGN